MKLYLQKIIVLVCVITASGCAKELLDIATEENTDCNPNGQHMTWSVDGNDVCADSFLQADFGDQVMSINGISDMVSSLTLDLQDTEVGVHDFNGASNFMLLTQLGFPWMSSDSLPGSFEITSHDLAHQKIAGTFQVDLFNEQTNNVKSIEGEFDVNYSD